MADRNETTDETLKIEGEPKSAAGVLDALKEAEDKFRDWQVDCDRIDDVFSLHSDLSVEGITDPELDLFWSSFGIMQQAIYARPPKPAVAARFSDRDPVADEAAEVLERALASTTALSGLHQQLQQVRDDLLFAGRGVLWAHYSTEGGQHIEFEHVDREDFRHGESRAWQNVPWVARRVWLTRDDAAERFDRTTIDDIFFRRAQASHDNREPGTIGIWEVWHKADKRVYWVTEGTARRWTMLRHRLTCAAFIRAPSRRLARRCGGLWCRCRTTGGSACISTRSTI